MKTKCMKGTPNGQPLPKQISGEAKRLLILEWIAKGMSYTQIKNKAMSDWGLSEKTVENYIHDVMDYMRREETKENLIAMNKERLDNIISDSMKDGDRKNAVKAIDVLNKMNNAYTETIKIDGDSEINLNFEF